MLKILARMLLICITIVIATYMSPIALDILKNYLGYQTPSGFFGFTFADEFMPLFLMLVFWSGIFFGTLGKKIDYAFIGLFTLLAALEYFGTEATTLQMHLGLIAAVITGNTIGFALKLLRQRFFVEVKDIAGDLKR